VADEPRVRILGASRSLRQLRSLSAQVLHQILGNVLELCKHPLGRLGVAAVADQTGDRAKVSAILITPPDMQRIAGGKMDGYVPAASLRAHVVVALPFFFVKVVLTMTLTSVACFWPDVLRPPATSCGPIGHQEVAHAPPRV